MALLLNTKDENVRLFNKPSFLINNIIHKCAK